MNITEMKYSKMLEMTDQLFALNLSEPIRFSFSNLKFIEPAGAVVFLSTIDKLIKENISFEFKPIDEEPTNAVS